MCLLIGTVSQVSEVAHGPHVLLYYTISYYTPRNELWRVHCLTIQSKSFFKDGKISIYFIYDIYTIFSLLNDDTHFHKK